MELLQVCDSDCAGMDSGITYETRRKYPSRPARNKLRSFRARKTRFAFCALHPCRLDCCIPAADGLASNAGIHTGRMLGGSRTNKLLFLLRQQRSVRCFQTNKLAAVAHDFQMLLQIAIDQTLAN